MPDEACSGLPGRGCKRPTAPSDWKFGRFGGVMFVTDIRPVGKTHRAATLACSHLAETRRSVNTATLRDTTPCRVAEEGGLGVASRHVQVVLERKIASVFLHDLLRDAHVQVVRVRASTVSCAVAGVFPYGDWVLDDQVLAFDHGVALGPPPATPTNPDPAARISFPQER